ncbi:MAG: hypothetical protein JST12_13160 [Armatimonadetes bacterium]|nr:hypothetical protein [Armatimonadota bacterium]
MTDLNSLPAGLQDKIDRANALLAESEQAELQGNRHLALVKAELGLRIAQEIAQQSPELGTLSLGGVMGHRGFEIEEVETRHEYVCTDKFFLVWKIGRHYTPVSMTRTTKRHFRFI